MIFSSRAIPGNELAVNRIINVLIERGVEVITDRDRAGPRLRPSAPRRAPPALRAGSSRQIAVPVHGEALHLAAHAELARELGRAEVVVVEDGDDGPACARAGREGRRDRGRPPLPDGSLVGGLEAIGVAERRRLAFAGHVAVSIVLDATRRVARPIPTSR